MMEAPLVLLRRLMVPAPERQRRLGFTFSEWARAESRPHQPMRTEADAVEGCRRLQATGLWADCRVEGLCRIRPGSDGPVTVHRWVIEARPVDRSLSSVYFSLMPPTTTSRKGAT